MSITIAQIKATYLSKLASTTELDTALTNIMNAVIRKCIAYLDNEDYPEAEDLPENVEDELRKQIAYEFNRRKDLGLSSVTAPDGTISKFDVGTWLGQVKNVLDNYRDLEF
jgi:hypothetical protein